MDKLIETIFIIIGTFSFLPSWYAFGDTTTIGNILVYWIIDHFWAWVSMIFLDVLNRTSLLDSFYVFFALIFIWILVDLLLYLFWFILNRYLRIRINESINKNEYKLFIFFRFIPFIGCLWVIMWSLWHSKLKKHLYYIFMWNIVFWLISIIFFVILFFPFYILFVINIIVLIVYSKKIMWSWS